MKLIERLRQEEREFLARLHDELIAERFGPRTDLSREIAKPTPEYREDESA